MDDVVDRAKYRDDIRGTFSRKVAVKHENVAFFAPYNPFFDGLTENAYESYKGRCAAFRYEKTGLDWRGMLLAWNIKFNPKYIYEGGFPVEAISLITKHLPLDQICTHSPLNEKYNKVIVEDILDALEPFQDEKPTHLGKRDNGAIDAFKRRLDAKSIHLFVKKANTSGRDIVKRDLAYKIDLKKAKYDLEDMLVANNARSTYYGSDCNNTLITSQEIIKALLLGLKNPIIELDSIAYIELSK